MFNGFTDNTIKFFLDIRFNNNAEFFHAHKAEYEAVKAEFAGFINALEDTVITIDKSIETRPSKCLARIRRDTRFTKDKSPYRDHLWLLFRRANEQRDGNPMFWFELSPESANWGLGIWGESKPYFDMLRHEILKNPNELLKIHKRLIEKHNKLELGGYNYKRMLVPDAVPELLKNYYTKKEFYISYNLENYNKIFQAELVDHIKNCYIDMADIYNYLRNIADKLLMKIDI